MHFDQIYQTYFHDVYVFSLALTGSDELAQDITQETFTKALKSINQFDGAKDIRAWLFTIARNTFYKLQKKQSRCVPQETIEESAAAELSPEERLVDQDSAFLIHQFLHTMPDPYKEVFSLRVFGELPFEKIGMLFGKSAGWARVTYHRAKKQIQDYMEAIDHGEN